MNFGRGKRARAADGRLGLVAAMALVMGNMIGSGVFLLPATLAPFGWNAVVGWIVTTAGAVVLALVLARLTRALPEAGSPPAFGPTAGFFINRIYLVSLWTTVATIAVAAVSYLANMIPALSAQAFRPALAALALVWLLALVNLRGVKAAGSFQIVTTAIKIIPLLVVIAIAAAVFVTGKRDLIPEARFEHRPAPGWNHAA
ncbi:amino acid permease, partial [Novosphingobium sp. P6W]|uniref:amino acid permease n=1 Tax=Novosphingobium sp. P6W TaxID=1609758 RepID=UPI0005C4A87B